MALFNVTNLFDSGTGSLRQAISDANSTAGADEIQFSSVSGTITLTSGELNITDSLTINGIGADLLTVSGNDASRVFNIGDATSNVINVYLNGLTISDGFSSFGGGIVSGENLTITNSTIADNSAAGSLGGGILSAGDLTITNSIISSNQAFIGGGIDGFGGARVTITDSTISGNQASANGGGVISSGDLTITNSTISDNSAGSGGGGILSLGEYTITNSTISGNQAFRGGGLYLYSGTITNSTISGNQANTGGGIFLYSYFYEANLNLANTIIANSTGGGADCTIGLNGTIITNTNNLIEDGTCNPALSGDPNLGPLQNNGGPTFTQALLPGSIAIDAGSNAAIPPGITTDQRGPGFPRIINGTVDIGAYEASQNGPPTVPESSSLFGVLTLGLVAVVSWRRRRK